MKQNNLSRRDFTKFLLGAGALALIETSGAAKIFAQNKRSMHWLAAQTASSEGVWSNLKVEGKIPRSLSGSLFRTAPGETERFGTDLNHLFDGDAFLTSWRFDNGKAQIKARFLPTPQRVKEQKAGKMIYSEFGTNAPKAQGGKNQPSVNVIEWNGKLLGLSEGGLPTVINPANFDYEGETDFGGVIPQNLAFTAHPRIDPKTGEMFAWGFEKGNSGAIHIYKISRNPEKAELLYKLSPDGFFMIHDAMLTENYFILIIPPMKYDIAALMTGKAANMGEAAKYAENEPTRVLVFPRDNQGGKAKPFEINLPAKAVFHYGNAFESGDGKIIFEAIWGKDGQILQVLNSWKRNKFDNIFDKFVPPTLQQITIDLNNQKLVGAVDLAGDVEFPRYDTRLTGRKSLYLYATERGYGADAAIVRINLKSGKTNKISAGKTRTFGEPVFVPTTSVINEDRGLILAQGFDADKNETFLEIRDAQTLDFAARIWANGQHFPLGFHGNFYEGI